MHTLGLITSSIAHDCTRVHNEQSFAGTPSFARMMMASLRMTAGSPRRFLQVAERCARQRWALAMSGFGIDAKSAPLAR